MRFGPLVDAAWLHEHIADPDVRVIDFRWYIHGRVGRDEYLGGHIPGAVFVDLDDVTGEEGAGRHPLPSAARFEEAMRTAGVDTDTRVVAYDDVGGSVASRLWFLLGHFGHRGQAVLDGGLRAWGGPLEAEVTKVARGRFRAHQPDPGRVLDWGRVTRRRKAIAVIVRIDQEHELQLSEIAHALDSVSFGFGIIQCRQKHGRQDSDDGNDDQQLDQSEGVWAQTHIGEKSGDVAWRPNDAGGDGVANSCGHAKPHSEYLEQAAATDRGRRVNCGKSFR